MNASPQGSTVYYDRTDDHAGTRVTDELVTVFSREYVTADISGLKIFRVRFWPREYQLWISYRGEWQPLYDSGEWWRVAQIERAIKRAIRHPRSS
jgi:hypothetical protein